MDIGILAGKGENCSHHETLSDVEQVPALCTPITTTEGVFGHTWTPLCQGVETRSTLLPGGS